MAASPDGAVEIDLEETLQSFAELSIQLEELERDDKKIILRDSWLEFVTFEMSALGLTHGLPRRRFRTRTCCHRSRINYPHWPPSSEEEAFDQLDCLLDEPKTAPHRMYLAECWLAFLYRNLAAGSNVSATIKLVEQGCPIILSGKPSLLGNKGSRRRVGRWERKSCEDICEPVLLKNKPFCLCCCPEHREDCPVHRY
ncbi:hypothetical protein V8E54_008289 [Elaphomyces granulatus]|jgi:hypothetical protein